MNHYDKGESEDGYEEPPLEDFLPNEEDEWLREKEKKRNLIVKRTVTVGVAIALIVSLLQIWPQVFNLSSINFLQKSAELSKREDILKYKEAVVTVHDQHSKGTGFNISRNGLIITNHHVVDNMYPITVTFPNGEIFRAAIIQSDPDIDLAFLQIEAENLPTLNLSQPNTWTVSDQIYVIGNPLLHKQIAIDGEILEGSDKNGLLLLNASIFNGNSGSPVISAEGHVIGVVFAISVKDQTGLAIPIEKVLKKLPNGY
ncbi:serine protease [Bacillus sp. DTU_2020_1000418_1_SI_GHA_SEK_038]|uniref:S1C family serine protease n=1 Tax=Bacillus sp. DTU_2020_1000418_1_SI_GHA_SEK_038 TaxID=3077585 RepID=UPI0028E5BC66|nr:serine protease [Bacillus sp. DTU_2020_1000418_1_SI_GHA_SEK_038]WNS73715.1 serine protease [Bacillus sp. DTU_2020_1000418_1_SI_GHA_SEK_038]